MVIKSSSMGKYLIIRIKIFRDILIENFIFWIEEWYRIVYWKSGKDSGCFIKNELDFGEVNQEEEIIQAYETP
jgi:hypothetical protein